MFNLRMLDLIGVKKERMEKEDPIGEKWRNGRFDGGGREERYRERDRGCGGGRVSAPRLVDSTTARCGASLTDGVSSSDSQTLSVVLRCNSNNNLQQSWNKVKRWSVARWADRERDSPSHPNTCGGNPGRTSGSNSASTRTTNATCAATGRWRNSDPGWESPACRGPPQPNGNISPLSDVLTRDKDGLNDYFFKN